jgi:hypothetical protein
VYKGTRLVRLARRDFPPQGKVGILGPELCRRVQVGMRVCARTAVKMRNAAVPVADRISCVEPNGLRVIGDRAVVLTFGKVCKSLGRGRRRRPLD